MTAAGEAGRAVWLFSLDSEGFHAAPTTTGSLIAWYLRHGARSEATAFRQVHYRERAEVEASAPARLAEFARAAAACEDPEFPPLAGLSVYTWNAAEFAWLAREIRRHCPGAVVVAGGPHVQQAADWLDREGIGLVVLGEGEAVFQSLLDTPRSRWPELAGIAMLRDDGELVMGAGRAQRIRLEDLPSPLEVVPLCDAEGRPLYDAVSYETTRGCPFRCAFCEWGTGAIGTKMLSFPLERVRADFERIVRAGIPNIWLADSNFGALRDDVEKARLICELKAAHGLPRSFATSWSKKHSPRVQEIVLMLHRHGLLPYYQLALQTLTPRALALCHRENMAANEYEPVAKRMAEAGVPISAELIWGLPGDDLASFEAGLGRLLAVFPDVNIFGYTLLPGTEFHDRREELQLQTVPVAGYGKAKGEYVVGSLSFGREEGEEGYLLISAHQWLVTGYVLSRTVRWMALEGSLPTGQWLRFAARRLLEAFAGAVPVDDPRDRLQVYEARAGIYLAMLAEPERLQQVLGCAMEDWLRLQDAARLRPVLQRLLRLDGWIRPRFGPVQTFRVETDIALPEVLDALGAMRLPEAVFDASQAREYRFESPGGLGVVLCSPDGGHWLQARLLAPEEPRLALERPADALIRLGV